jgi:hypothetical protein
MAEKETVRRHLERRTGSLEQVAGIRRAVLQGGRQEGTAVSEIRNGGGLAMSVLESACLDILDLSWKGVNLGFLAPAGLVNPSLAEQAGGDFAGSFRGGMLYTCGLSNVGPGGEVDGVFHPTHGRIGRVGAEDLRISRNWHEEGGVLGIAGTMRETGLFRDGFTLERRLETPCFSNRVTLVDQVRNDGFADLPLFLLHHWNFGYPLLDAGTRIVTMPAEVTPRDAQAATGLSQAFVMQAPQDGAEEQVFYHRPVPDTDGLARVAVVNDALRLAVVLSFDPAVQPHLVIWKSFRSGSYALGIEPATCTVEGRMALAHAGRMPDTLAAGTVRTFIQQLDILEGEEAIREAGL